MQPARVSHTHSFRDVMNALWSVETYRYWHLLEYRNVTCSPSHPSLLSHPSLWSHPSLNHRGHQNVNVPFVYPLTLWYRRGQGSSAALHMEYPWRPGLSTKPRVWPSISRCDSYWSLVGGPSVASTPRILTVTTGCWLLSQASSPAW